ncbi:MAG TPA: hypothetical protein VMA75_04360 [Candidatus Paceibacterota bacterium]|nr:hypothetical protein [Candidatus Paceibacterota bacterium]
MLIDYLIVASAVAVASLIWWNWLDDHPAFHAWVKKLPIVGHPLDCSFCFPLWLTFFSMFFFQPLAAPAALLLPWPGIPGMVGRFILEWFSLGAGVLFIRHSIFAIREIGAVFNHQHRKNHENDLAL